MARWVPIQELFDELEEQATEREAVAAGGHDEVTPRRREPRRPMAAAQPRDAAASRRGGPA